VLDVTGHDLILPACIALGGTIVATLAVGAVLVFLPADYFDRAGEKKPASVEQPALRVVWKVGKNLLGVVLIVLGLVMFVAPGPGVLTILLGLVLVDIPGRFKVVRAIISRPRIFKAVNELRRRCGKPPFKQKAQKAPELEGAPSR
jgi:quinol-cytochrome oxidoreductase complex cytochrome b subunit